MADIREQELVIILADISGYTRFMLDNRTSALHGQLCISGLIDSLLREVDIPLQLQEIEGDAVFLYAEHSGDEAAWQDVRARIGAKLMRFFDVFFDALVTMAESNLCECAVCTHLYELGLKIVVHSGRAVFHTVGGRAQVSGPDVIIAHRLLKNSIRCSEYLLMSASAHRDVGAAMGLEFTPGVEQYPEIGALEVLVHRLDRRLEATRGAFYALIPSSLAARGRRFVLDLAPALLVAAMAQFRHPAYGGRSGALLQVLMLALVLPVKIAVAMVCIPRQLLARRAARAQRPPAPA